MKRLGTMQEKKREQQEEGSRVGMLSKYRKFLRQLNLKHKIKHFIWKCLNGILPVKEVLVQRIGIGDTKCCRCGEMDKSLEHMFFFCTKSVSIWELAPIKCNSIEHKRKDFSKWWCSLTEVVKRDEGRQHIQFTCFLLWHIRKARNIWLFSRQDYLTSRRFRRH